MKNKLKVYRAMHDLTQEDLADRVEVTRQTTNAIEKRKYLPSLDLAFKLVKLFEIEIEDLFVYGGNKNEDEDEKGGKEMEKLKNRKWKSTEKLQDVNFNETEDHVLK
jgi:putative transcriptional regulator